MVNTKLNNKKFVFIGDLNSINSEVIIKSFNIYNKYCKLLFVCSKKSVQNELLRFKSNIKINIIYDPISFLGFQKNSINIFEIPDKSKFKYINLLNQLNVCNELCNLTGFDLITFPINKSVIKKHINFNGITEYLGEINKTKTLMLMYGENFSIIPVTTHINPKTIHLHLSEKKITAFLNFLFKKLNKNKELLHFKYIKYLCYNPHCGENGLLGNEDIKIKKILLKKFNKKIIGPIPADSAFNNYNKNTLFLSNYHDQALIPFKILNPKGVNLTIGLKYKRISPAHGTASDIKYKGLANVSSFLRCTQI